MIFRLHHSFEVIQEDGRIDQIDTTRDCDGDTKLSEVLDYVRTLKKPGEKYRNLSLHFLVVDENNNRVTLG